MKENGIYFGARGMYYTSFYCAYLLGILEYNPIEYSLSYESNLDYIAGLDLDVESQNYEIVIDFLRENFSRNQLYSLAYYNEKSGKWEKHGVSFSLFRSEDINHLEVERIT